MAKLPVYLRSPSMFLWFCFTQKGAVLVISLTSRKKILKCFSDWQAVIVDVGLELYDSTDQKKAPTCCESVSFSREKKVSRQELLFCVFRI